MANKTWNNAGAGNASTGTWSPVGAPVAGDNIIFDATSVQNCTWNIAATFGTFTIAAGYSGTITQGAVDFRYSDFSMAGGVWTGNAPTRTQTCSGSISKTGGTYSNYATYLIMTGMGKTMSTLNLGGFEVAVGASITTTGGPTGVYGGSSVFHIHGTVIIGSTVLYVYNNMADVVIDGTVSGTGDLNFNSYVNGNLNGITGTITARVKFTLDGATSTLSLIRNQMFGGAVIVTVASNTITLNLAGYSLSATTITASTGGIISGRGSVYCDGTLTATLGTISTLEGSWYADKIVGCGAMGNAIGTNRTCSKTAPKVRNDLCTELGGSYNG